MKNLYPIITIISSVLVGISIGYFLFKSPSKTKEDNFFNSKNSPNEFSLKKGGVYVKKFGLNLNDPFSKPDIDTITILDLKSSYKDNNLIYVKWTFNKWKDTSRYISSEMDYMVKDIQELK